MAVRMRRLSVRLILGIGKTGKSGFPLKGLLTWLRIILYMN